MLQFIARQVVTGHSDRLISAVEVRVWVRCPSLRRYSEFLIGSRTLVSVPFRQVIMKIINV